MHIGFESAKIDALIDRNIIPIDPKKKIIIIFLVLIVPIVLVYFFIFSKNFDEIESIENKIKVSSEELDKVRRASRDLPKHEKTLQETKEIFELTSVLLPKSQEIPDLLRNISDLGKQSGLDFLSFIPGVEMPKDFYAEIPIDIKIRGPYHNLGLFLDRVSKLDRIVTVNNIKTEKVDLDGTEALLTSSCRLITYRFTNQKIEPPKKK